MNHNEKTFWEMLKKCMSFLNANIGIWKSNTLISEDVDNLVKKEKELADSAKMQSDNHTDGHVAQKKQEFNAVAKSVYKLGRSLCHLAKKTNNQVLLSIVDIPESGFTQGEEKELMSLFKSVLAASRENLDALAVYGKTLATIDEIEAQRQKLEVLPETISVVEGLRKGATRSIKELSGEVRLILDQLDDLFEAVITDDTFVEGWFDARKIKGRHIPVKKAGDNGEEITPTVNEIK